MENNTIKERFIDVQDCMIRLENLAQFARRYGTIKNLTLHDHCDYAIIEYQLNPRGIKYAAYN